MLHKYLPNSRPHYQMIIDIEVICNKNNGRLPVLVLQVRFHYQISLDLVQYYHHEKVPKKNKKDEIIC